MLIVISPAKRLDWSERVDVPVTAPAFAEEAVRLAALARTKSEADLQKMMAISPALARLTRDRFAAFAERPETADLRPAVDAFAGDTYVGLDSRSLDDEERNWAQEHLRILSGLYGLLRPHDGIQPYRLEMGSRLANRSGRNLYDFWGDRLAAALRDRAGQMGTGILVNCASAEYFGAVPEGALGLRVIHPVFLEDKPAGPKIVSFFAKKARGAMARFIIQNRLSDPDSLRDFDTGGYAFQPDMSTSVDRPVFLRAAENAVAA